MYWRIEVKDKEGVFSCFEEALKTEIKNLGYREIEDLRLRTVYFLIGTVTREEADKIAQALLIDSVIQEYNVYSQEEIPLVPAGYQSLQIMYKPGVMDPVEESTLKAVRD